MNSIIIQKEVELSFEEVDNALFSYYQIGRPSHTSIIWEHYFSNDDSLIIESNHRKRGGNILRSGDDGWFEVHTMKNGLYVIIKVTSEQQGMDVLPYALLSVYKLFIAFCVLEGFIKVEMENYIYTVSIGEIMGILLVSLGRFVEVFKDYILEREKQKIYMTRAEYNVALSYMCYDSYKEWGYFFKVKDNYKTMFRCLYCEHENSKGDKYRLCLHTVIENDKLYSTVRSRTRDFYIDNYLQAEFPVDHGGDLRGLHHKIIQGEHGHSRIKIDKSHPDGLYALVFVVSAIRLFIKSRRNRLYPMQMQAVESYIEYIVFYPWKEFKEILIKSVYMKRFAKVLFYIIKDREKCNFKDFSNDDKVSKWVSGDNPKINEYPDIPDVYRLKFIDRLELFLSKHGCGCKLCYDTIYPINE